MSDSKPFTGVAHASGEYDANDEDPDVTYTISNINRVDGKRFVRFQVNLASDPGHGWFVDVYPEGARWIGQLLIARADEIDPGGRAS